MAGGPSVMFGAAPEIQPGNTDLFRVCFWHSLMKSWGQTPDRMSKTIRLYKE